MTTEERKLLDKLSKMELPEYERELNVLLETYDFDNCSEDFDDEFRYQMARKYLKDFENDDTPFEEALEKWFNSLSKEDQEAFLTRIGANLTMLNSYEKKLYEHWKTLDWDSYYKESLNYDFNTFSEEFNSLIRDNILDKAFENIEEDTTPYEEAIEKWFNSLSKEDREAFLNEDWSELDG